MMRRAIGHPAAHRQRGVALITVLFVFFMASTLAVAMLARQQLDIRKTINLASQVQGRQYALGAETHIRELLFQDWQADNENGERIDHLQEAWAAAEQDFEIEEGVLQIHTEDLQGRFNLASLVTEGQPDMAAMEQLKRLLVLLEVNPAIADQLLDWIDDNMDAFGPNGAEDNDYLITEPPYRAANRMPADSSELLLLPLVDMETLRRIRPYITVLPEATPINLNTASVPVLRSLSPDKSAADVEGWVEQREEAPFTDVEQFLGDNALDEKLKERLSVASDYFRLAVRVQYADRAIHLISRIMREPEEGGLITLTRDYSQRFDPSEQETDQMGNTDGR